MEEGGGTGKLVVRRRWSERSRCSGRKGRLRAMLNERKEMASNLARRCYSTKAVGPAAATSAHDHQPQSKKNNLLGAEALILSLDC